MAMLGFNPTYKSPYRFRMEIRCGKIGRQGHLLPPYFGKVCSFADFADAVLQHGHPFGPSRARTDLDQVAYQPDRLDYFELLEGRGPCSDWRAPL